MQLVDEHGKKTGAEIVDVKSQMMRKPKDGEFPQQQQDDSSGSSSGSSESGNKENEEPPSVAVIPPPPTGAGVEVNLNNESTEDGGQGTRNDSIPGSSGSDSGPVKERNPDDKSLEDVPVPLCKEDHTDATEFQEYEGPRIHQRH